MGESVEVALPFNLPNTLTYISPIPLSEALGRRVLVPLRRKVVVGCVVGPSDPVPQARDIKHFVDERPILTHSDIDFARWISKRYFYPLGLTLKHFFPPSFFLDSGGVFTTSRLCVEGFEDIASYVSKKGYGATKRELYRLFGRERVEEAIGLGVLVPPPPPTTERFKKKMVIYSASGDVPSGLKGKKEKIYSYLRENGPKDASFLRKLFKVTGPFLERMVSEGILEKREVEVLPSGFGLDVGDGIKELSSHQEMAVDGILRGGREHLLFGVTGSGKTFCYLEVARRVVEDGRQVLIVVPEVSLTPQLLSRIKGFFPEGRVGLYHSYLSDRERSLVWFRCLDGEFDVVLGTRSSIFLPLRRLGLIVIDEEHDPSLQQDSGLRYDVRELAGFISSKRGVKVVYSSATPSFEVYHRAVKGEVSLHVLPERFKVGMPEVEVVDMREEEEIAPYISRRLVEAMEDTLSKGKQVIIFHTRRGYSTYAICSKCGYSFKCVNCSLTMVYHRRDRVFRCHWCGYQERFSGACPSCGGEDIRFYGTGSERVEEAIRALFEGISVERLDSDTVRKKGRLSQILSRFYMGEIDVLVGTSMVVKGHDFPGVYLVGVTGTDNILNLPDYKASERNFQLLAQVSGRPGRKGEGRVIIQTYNPSHYSIRHVLNHDFPSFFQEEMAFREELGYPPFLDILLFIVRSKDRALSLEVSKGLFGFLSARFPGLSRFGPFPAPVPRMKGFYRSIVMVKGKKEALVDVGWSVKKGLKLPGSVSLEMQINPETLLV